MTLDIIIGIVLYFIIIFPFISLGVWIYHEVKNAPVLDDEWEDDPDVIDFILIPSITFALAYLFFVFIKMNFNAFEWSEGIRISYVVISTILSIVAIGVYLNEKN